MRQRLRKFHTQSNATQFNEVEIVVFGEVCSEMEGVETVAVRIVFSRYEVTFVSVQFVGTSE